MNSEFAQVQYRGKIFKRSICLICIKRISQYAKVWLKPLSLAIEVPLKKEYDTQELTMKNIIRSFVVGFVLLILASGCANVHTKKELFEIFNAKGFNTTLTDRGLVVFLPELFFEFDSTVLTQPAHDQLLVISDVLTDPRTIAEQILIEGHADFFGDDAYNDALSLRRANVVADVLVLGGVNDNRITRRGYGRRYPIAPNITPKGLDNPEGRSLNRRVEIVLEDPAQP